MPNATVRDAVAADLQRVGAIYAHEAEHGISTFDTLGRPAEFWQDKLAAPDPLLVGLSGKIVAGFAYASVYRPRPAYDRTREVSVYLAAEARGQGIGRALYAELLGRLRAAGMHTALAVVALPNEPSVRLHESFGFTSAGTLREVGRKCDRWIDTAVLQLML
ncbi:MAG: N-acetyltransferase family protein [Actinomycetota bacterium]|nr:N-acetyltransferase family protein [Actinomycetota bacterium]